MHPIKTSLSIPSNRLNANSVESITLASHLLRWSDDPGQSSEVAGVTDQLSHPAQEREAKCHLELNDRSVEYATEKAREDGS